MNLDERYACPAHPDTTIGATPGETEPPTCLTCNRTMTLIAPTESRVQHDQDRRQAHTSRRESTPL